MRKTQEDTLKFFITKPTRHAKQQTQGGIECETQTDIKYTEFEWRLILTLLNDLG